MGGSDCLVASSCSCFLVSKFLQDSPTYEAEQGDARAVVNNMTRVDIVVL